MPGTWQWMCDMAFELCMCTRLAPVLNQYCLLAVLCKPACMLIFYTMAATPRCCDMVSAKQERPLSEV